ncbi:MAG: hypothetical protein MI757_10175 [Pirellulales bacterium]|nr:hypothetical protein [Pirellulales bacterium]
MHPRDELVGVLGISVGLVTLGAPRLAQRSTCPTLRYAAFLLHVLDCLSSPRRAQ